MTRISKKATVASPNPQWISCCGGASGSCARGQTHHSSMATGLQMMVPMMIPQVAHAHAHAIVATTQIVTTTLNHTSNDLSGGPSCVLASLSNAASKAAFSICICMKVGPMKTMKRHSLRKDMALQFHDVTNMCRSEKKALLLFVEISSCWWRSSD